MYNFFHSMVSSRAPQRSVSKTGVTDNVAAKYHSLGHSLAEFAADLFRQLAHPTAAAESDKGGTSSGSAGPAPDNVVFSPFAVGAALSMTLAGAHHATAKELASALHVPDDSRVHEHFSAQLSRISNQALNFDMTNRMYADSRFPLAEGYLAFLRGTYGDGAASSVDFAGHHEDVRAEVNARVSRETVRQLAGLLHRGSLGKNTEILIVSAASFHGEWQSPFQTTFTDASDFFVDGNTTVRVDMMNQMGTFGTAHCPDMRVTALEMPHRGGKTSMVVLLPDDCEGLDFLESNMTGIRLVELLQRLRDTPNVMLKLPKFSVKMTGGLRRPLKALGVDELFTTRANLSGIFETGCPVVADLFHGAFLDVNEQGVTLGSASSPAGEAAISGEGPGMGTIRHIAVNRPFMFLIRPLNSDIFFFVGSVRRP